jgi:hypothetical protein
MKWASLLIACLTFVVGQEDDVFVTVSCAAGTDGFDYSVVVNDELTMQYSITTTDDVEYFTARLTYAGVGWVAWGISPDGEMVGSNAVIGLPGDAVYTYDLTGKDTSLVIASDTQDQIDATIDQTGLETVLQFSRPLNSVNGEISSGVPFNHLFAYRDGRNTLSTHTTRGAFYLALSTCDELGDPTSAPTSGGDAELEAEIMCTSDLTDFENRQEIDDNLTFYWTIFTDNDEEFIKARIVYEDEGWVAWGLSPDGVMEGTLAIIGLPDVGVSLYDLNGYSTSSVEIRTDDEQTLTETTITQENGITTVDFTRSLAADQADDLPLSSSTTDTFVWAYRTDNTFAQHTSKGTVMMNFGDCVSGVLASDGIVVDDPLFTDAQIHGVLMMAAWFGLVPLAIGVARFGRRSKKWFYGHFILQISALVLVITGLILAIKLPSVEDNHFYNIHGRLGLAIVIGAFVQIVFAMFRPHLPTNQAYTGVSHTSLPPLPPPTTEYHPPKKSLLRRLWEISHKLLGTLLLLSAFYNIREGIELPAAETTASWEHFWLGMVISILGLFFVLEIMKLIKPVYFKPAESDGNVEVPVMITVSPQPHNRKYEPRTGTIPNKISDPLIR